MQKSAKRLVMHTQYACKIQRDKTKYKRKDRFKKNLKHSET